MPRPCTVKRSALAVAILLVTAAALTGCGGRVSGEARAIEPGRWRHVPMALSPGPDSPVLMTATGGRVVALTTGEQGAVRSAVLTADGATRGTPLQTGATYATLGGLAHLDDRYVAVGSGGLLDRTGGDDELLFRPLVVSSRDGVTWERTEVTGLEGPLDVNDLAATDGALVAVGNLRTAPDPGNGGFLAAIWRSTDGVSWTPAQLPVGRGDSHVRGVAAVGDHLLAVGEDGRGATLWRSDDDGVSWSPVDLADARPDRLGTVSDIAADGETVLIGVDGGDTGYLRSTDGGLTWEEPEQPPPVSSESYTQLGAAGERWWSWVSLYDEPDLAECYAAPDDCGQDGGGLYVSDDGDVWARVDPAGLQGEALHTGPAVTAPDGGVALFDTGGVSLLPSGVGVPSTREPTPERAGIIEVPSTGPEVGVRYAAPLYLHCSSEWLYLGEEGEVWRRTDQRGDVPESWGVGDTYGSFYGFATLTSPDRLEYSKADGTVLAEYERTTVSPPGCA